MRIKINRIISFLSLFFIFSGLSFAEAEVNDQIAEIVNYDTISHWVFVLLVVIGLFLGCVWIMKKMGALSPIHSKDKMKVVAGLSLGGREKILLVQVGEKQLVLGVSPGKIDNLLVLDGDDRVFQEKNHSTRTSDAENDFSQKLKQIIKGSLND